MSQSSVEVQHVHVTANIPFEAVGGEAPGPGESRASRAGVHRRAGRGRGR
jgi:hypothetical protein